MPSACHRITPHVHPSHTMGGQKRVRWRASGWAECRAHQGRWQGGGDKPGLPIFTPPAVATAASQCLFHSEPAHVAFLLATHSVLTLGKVGYVPLSWGDLAAASWQWWAGDGGLASCLWWVVLDPFLLEPRLRTLCKANIDCKNLPGRAHCRC